VVVVHEMYIAGLQVPHFGLWTQRNSGHNRCHLCDGQQPTLSEDFFGHVDLV